MLSCRSPLGRGQLPHTAFKLFWMVPPLGRGKLPHLAMSILAQLFTKQPKLREEIGNFSSFHLLLTLQALLKSLNQRLVLHLSTVTTPHLPSLVVRQPVLTQWAPVLPNSHQLLQWLPALLLHRTTSLRGCFISSNSVSLFPVPGTSKLPLP